MKIDRIEVSAGRTFNHPHEDYSNFRTCIRFSATVGEGEDPVLAAKSAQAVADRLADEEKKRILARVHRQHRIEKLDADIEQAACQFDDEHEAIERLLGQRQVFETKPDSEERTAALQSFDRQIREAEARLSQHARRKVQRETEREAVLKHDNA